MHCENHWPSQPARVPRTLRAGARITWRQQTLARAHCALWVLFIALQVADVVTTNYALSDLANREANPIMEFSQAHLGAAWWLPKIVAVGFGALAVRQTLRPWPIVLAVSYYIIVVSGNLASL